MKFSEIKNKSAREILELLAAEKKTIGVIMTGDIPYYSKRRSCYRAKTISRAHGEP